MMCVVPPTSLNRNRQRSGPRGFCECQRHSAYNTTSCRCQEAELCSHLQNAIGGKGNKIL